MDREIKLKGDKVSSNTINKRQSPPYQFERKYIWDLAEIGAGQETVRHFFRSGGSSGTIAKAMSAYDKDFSDAIYGREETLRN
jgi:hypothetical protein